MGYSSTEISLANRKKYPYYYRTSVTEESHALARISFFKHFNWKKVAIVHAVSGTFPSVSSTLTRSSESKTNLID